MTTDLRITIPRPDDWHVHLRDNAMLRAVTPFTANVFRYALIMPNLASPVTSVEMASCYQQRIIAAAGPDATPDFQPLMTLYLNRNMCVGELLAGHREGIIHAAKFYPAGATTNSEAGGESLLAFMATLQAMAANKVPLLVHAESTDPSVDIFDREAAFLEQQLRPVCDELPELRVTVEHLSTADGVDFVRSHSNVGGSITPHHLTRVRSDILGSGLHPDLYCKPVLNSFEDRSALVAAATSGDPAFFLGTDSAPHPQRLKIGNNAKPGIFNAPYALETVADVFAQADELNNLAAFVSTNGARHYGLPVSTGRLELSQQTHRTHELPTHIRSSDGSIVNAFGAEYARHWTLRTL